MIRRRYRHVLTVGFAGALAVGAFYGVGQGPADASPSHTSAASAARPAATSGLPALGLNVRLVEHPAATQNQVTSQLAAMGATWIREAVNWRLLQPNPGTFDSAYLAKVRSTVSAAKAAGLRVLMTADNQAPDWARAGTDQDLTNAYGSFVGQLAADFKGTGPGGVSPAYEIMNEPQGGASGSAAPAAVHPAQTGLPSATPELYTQAACAAYHSAHAADSTAKVAAGSINTSVDWQPWLRQVFADGIGSCYDVLTVHSYSGPDPLDVAEGIAADNGRPNTTIYLGEFGGTTCPQSGSGCVPESYQSSLITNFLNDLTTRPFVPVAMIYEACDTPGLSSPRESYFGVFHSTSATAICTSAKPAVAALTALYQ